HLPPETLRPRLRMSHSGFHSAELRPNLKPFFKQELCKFAGKPNQSFFSIGSIKTKSGSAAKCRLPTFVYTECAFFGAMGGVSK
ncbi:hypothetical protein P7M41_25960, partial [Vibrio parahaemolyticus]|nr:hypothetical protein [Vibrio parahaemolyticus]